MKKKILFMVQLPPPVHGASLRNLSLYESKLLQKNFNIKLLQLAFADSILTIGKFSVTKILKFFRYAAALFIMLITFKPDIAYFTITPAGAAFFRDSFFVLILKLFGVPVIYHLRGLGVNGERQKNWLNGVLYKFVFRNTFVVCLSEKHLFDIKGLDYRKHFVVPNGIKIEMKPEFITSNGSDKKNFLYFSNFIRSKGVLEFLEALKKLKTHRKDFKALLVGADYDLTTTEIKKYVNESGLTDCVTVTGPRYEDDKFRTIANCDIFVFPTYFELFPGVVLEAMQCGKPIISTTTGAIPEIIDNDVNGLLVEPRNVDELAEKMNYLIENPEAARSLGLRAQEKFYNCFTLDRFEQNVNSVFEQVLESAEKMK